MSAVDASAVARVVGIDTVFKDLRGGNIRYLPQRIAVIGQGTTAATYSTDKAQVTSAFAVGSAYGFGSPLHLAAKQLLPVNGDGVGTIPVTVYPMDDDGAGVAAAGDVTPSGSVTAGTESYQVKVNNILSEAFNVTVGDAVADIIASMIVAVNAVVDMPVVASDGTTVLDLTAKWEGVSGNDIYVEVVSPDTASISFAVVQATGGLNNPSIAAALAQIGDAWETLILNCLEFDDTTALGLLQAEGEGRWDGEVRKPFIAFVGYNGATVATAIAVTDARKTDRINSVLASPASHDLPCVIAGRMLARIATRANNNPPVDYAGAQATGLTPTAVDSSIWTYAERDQAVKGGCSTSEVWSGVSVLSDTVTCYHPDGEDPPAFRYVVDIIKVMNILYNLGIIFDAEDWRGAPLIPDNQPTVNPAAKQPKAAITEIAAMIDSLGLEAIISNPETAKANTTASINGSNPKRLDVALIVELSGNTNILSIAFNFGFFFG